MQGSVHVHIAKLATGAPASHVSAATVAAVSVNDDLHARLSVTASAGGLVPISTVSIFLEFIIIFLFLSCFSA
jgi:hypothetical protein